MSIKNSNQQTLQSYEAHTREYIDGTTQVVEGFMKEWLDEIVNNLPKTAKILEIGSAFGRDASYLQNLGFTVECTDATRAFVDLLSQKGFLARELNAITDELGKEYDLILANAVLLHFTREEVKLVLKKALAALSSKGVFAFTLKHGEGEKWSEDKLGAPRYFCFWTKEQITQLVEEVGFIGVEVAEDVGARNVRWLQIIGRKR